MGAGRLAADRGQRPLHPASRDSRTPPRPERLNDAATAPHPRHARRPDRPPRGGHRDRRARAAPRPRSEEHTSELQSLMRISYAVFCLKKKTHTSELHPTITNLYYMYSMTHKQI